MLNKQFKGCNYLTNKDSWHLDAVAQDIGVFSYNSEVILEQSFVSAAYKRLNITEGLLASKNFPFNQSVQKVKGTTLQTFSRPPKP